ncbi:MAG: DUF4810 domain-containing protein [Bacteroidota bacterium]|nr:DUF4810 domain-containing protein [Bacteroidota bacterium]
MKIKFSLLLAIIVMQFIGCKPEAQFFWGNYSKTLYAYKKSPSDKTLADHKKSLTEIISVSLRKRKPVPPGVYAELGFIFEKEGNSKDGMDNFNQEIILYPESKEFIEKLENGFQSGENK